MTTGVKTNVAYLFEDNGFNTAPSDSTHKAFGADAQLQTAAGSNQASQILAPGTDYPVDTIEGMFSGSWSMSFSVTNPWWLAMVMENPTTTGSGPYTHTYDGHDPQSFQLVEGFTESGKLRTLKGCVASSMGLSVAVGQPARVTLQGAYADEGVTTPGSVYTQPVPSDRPQLFSGGELSIGGQVQAVVQSASLSMNLNTSMLAGLGSRFAVDYNPHVRQSSLSINKYKVSGETDTLEDMYGGSTTPQTTVENKATAVLTLDNGKSGSNERSWTITASGTFPESYAEQGIGNPQADVTEAIQRYAEDVDIAAVNNTSAAP